MKTGVLALAVLLLAAGGPARAGEASKDDDEVSARLAPKNEVPAVSSPAARGVFNAKIDAAARTIDYELSFVGLQADIIMSHLHFAQRDVNGAIVVWLCGTTATPTSSGPAGTQTCAGPREGTIGGTIRPTQVQTVAPQGIATGDAGFDRLVRAIRDGLVYVNVHTVQSPGGEIRGQLKADD